MALGSTWPLTEVSTRNIFWGSKCHFHVPTVMKSGSPILLKPLGPVQASTAVALLFKKFKLG